MRKRLIACTSILVLLSGCSSGGGLGAYLISSGEVPDGCSLLPYDSDEGEFLQEAFNWTGNPGSVDNRIFREDGVEPVDNLVGLYECDEGEIASIALRYASAEQVEQVAGDDGDCDDPEEKWITSGPVLAFVEGDEDVPGMAEALEDWVLRMVAQTGAVDPCAPSGNQTA